MRAALPLLGSSSTRSMSDSPVEQMPMRVARLHTKSCTSLCANAFAQHQLQATGVLTTRGYACRLNRDSAYNAALFAHAKTRQPGPASVTLHASCAWYATNYEVACREVPVLYLIINLHVSRVHELQARLTVGVLYNRDPVCACVAVLIPVFQ